MDSAAAANLVEKLRDLANEGKTIIAVIHQPSQHVFSMFDDLLLMGDGRQMYYGPVSDVRAYMERQGCQPEKEVGTAEFVLECISRVPRMKESEDDAHKRLDDLAAYANEMVAKQLDLGTERALAKSGQKILDHSTAAEKHGPRANLFKQFRVLLKRAMVEAFRGKGLIVLKMVQQVTVAVIYGGIYKLGNNQVCDKALTKLMPSCYGRLLNLFYLSSLGFYPRSIWITQFDSYWFQQHGNCIYSTCFSKRKGYCCE